MGTELGLARFDPHTEKFSNFDARDVLVIGEESEGSACFQNQQGEMFFGSSQGVNTFFPDQIRDNPNPPRWDYVYYFRRGESGATRRSHVIVWFDGDLVTRVEHSEEMNPANEAAKS